MPGNTKAHARRAIPQGFLAHKPAAHLDFFSQIANAPASGFEARLQALAKAWLDCTECDFVWLWQYNRATEIWQLIAHASVRTAVGADLPKIKFLNLNNSVTEYAARLARPIFVSDIGAWKEFIDAERFSITSSAELTRLSVKSFCTVPLLPVSGSTNHHRSRQTDLAICFHYRTPKRRVPFSEELLLLKGKISNYFIQSAISDNCKSIITDLHTISAPFLRGKNQEATTSRKDYADKVLNYCKERLGLVYGSIFLSDISGDYIECVSTTGLYDKTNRKVSSDDECEKVYAAGECRTGWVFSSGRAIVSTLATDNEGLDGKFREMPRSIPETDIPWVIYPIFASNPLPIGAGDSDKCIGVLRGTGIGNAADPAAREITPFDVANIDCVCSYIGVVFCVLNNNIIRDEQVACVKHDIGAPLHAALASSRAVGHHAEELFRVVGSLLWTVKDKAAVQANQQILRNRLRDIEAAVSISLLLVPELDRNPVEKLRLSITDVCVESDVIAPLAVSFRHYAMTENEMRIAFHGFDKFPNMRLDKFEMWRAIGNLLMNSIKYGTEKSEISVVGLFSRKRQSYVISVQNYGIGIKEADKRKIFNGRYRAIEAQQEATGEGLGLKIAKRIVRLHGGYLELSQLAGPTIFSIVLPKEIAQ